MSYYSVARIDRKNLKIILKKKNFFSSSRVRSSLPNIVRNIGIISVRCRKKNLGVSSYLSPVEET